MRLHPEAREGDLLGQNSSSVDSHTAAAKRQFFCLVERVHSSSKVAEKAVGRTVGRLVAAVDGSVEQPADREPEQPPPSEESWFIRGDASHLREERSGGRCIVSMC